MSLKGTPRNIQISSERIQKNVFSKFETFRKLLDLSNLNLSVCKKLHSKDRLAKPSKEVMTTREEVAAYQKEIKKSMK